MPNTQARLTVVTRIYHQIPGSNPTHVALGYTRNITTPEQAWIRSPSQGIGPEWTPLNLGWLETASLVVVENRESDPNKIIEIKFSDSEYPLTVFPGEGIPLSTNHWDKLLIRCPNGVALYTVTGFPS